MTSRRLSPLLAGLSVLAAAAATSLAAPAAALAPTTLYANPQGTGGSCNKVDPCSIGTAFTNASSGDNIVIEPGTYQAGSTTLAEPASNVHVAGVPNAGVPVIDSSATVGINIASGSSITGVDLNFTGTDAGLVLSAASATAGAAGSHVSVHATAGSACRVFGSLTDSLCVTTAANSFAVGGTHANATYTPVLRGVTAVATQATSRGIDYNASANGSITVTATNTIARGGLAGVEADAGDDATAAVTVSHSDFTNAIGNGTGGGSAKVVLGTGNLSSAPRFVDAAKGNYAQAAGSATIDAGAADPKTDVTDLAGRPRVIGGRVDIGAYEYAFAPTLRKLVVTAAAKSVRLSVAVNPDGRATKVYFVLRGGKKPIRSATLSAGAGAARVTLSARLKGLTPKTKYMVYATAKNGAGRQTTKTVKFTTT